MLIYIQSIYFTKTKIKVYKTIREKSKINKSKKKEEEKSPSPPLGHLAQLACWPSSPPPPLLLPRYRGQGRGGHPSADRRRGGHLPAPPHLQEHGAPPPRTLGRPCLSPPSSSRRASLSLDAPARPSSRTPWPSTPSRPPCSPRRTNLSRSILVVVSFVPDH